MIKNFFRILNWIKCTKVRDKLGCDAIVATETLLRDFFHLHALRGQSLNSNVSRNEKKFNERGGTGE